MSRPAKGRKYPKIIATRFSERDYSELKSLALKQGLSISDFIRVCVGLEPLKYYGDTKTKRKLYYLDNLEKKREYQRTYYREHKERLNIYKKQYRMTLREINEKVINTSNL